MKLSKAIKAAREKAGLSQAQLADKLGVSPSTVAGWELADHGVRFARLKEIAKATGIDVSELVA